MRDCSISGGGELYDQRGRFEKRFAASLRWQRHGTEHRPVTETAKQKR